jgi:hypothetical protein
MEQFKRSMFDYSKLKCFLLGAILHSRALIRGLLIYKVEKASVASLLLSCKWSYYKKAPGVSYAC